MHFIIDSSPREDGNGNWIADRLAEKYPDSERLKLSKMTYSGCKACGSCRKNNSFCIQNDDLGKYLSRFAEANGLILVAPNYMGFINGTAKSMLDRFYCMRTAEKMSRFKEGTKFAFLLTQGSHNRDKGSAAVDWMKRFAENYQLKYLGLTVPGCNNDNLDGIKLKKEDILMNFSFFF